jgi:hypothetical protein
MSTRFVDTVFAHVRSVPNVVVGIKRLMSSDDILPQFGGMGK